MALYYDEKVYGSIEESRTPRPITLTAVFNNVQDFSIHDYWVA